MSWEVFSCVEVPHEICPGSGLRRRVGPPRWEIESFAEREGKRVTCPKCGCQKPLDRDGRLPVHPAVLRVLP